MSSHFYNRGLDELRDWTTGTYRWMLVTTSYTFNRDHDFVATPAAAEVDASGYSRVTASGKSRTIDDTNDRITYDCADPAFGAIAAGESVRGVILYKFESNDSDSPLVCFFDLIFTTDGAAYTPQISANGVAYVDQAATSS